ncbi:MAG: glycoside hydrolase family 32 protein [Lachnospiraceae bacterium]|nr:glycoside hydrolase family 32 protein [Lachnospiraceae bacterium]
MESQKLREARKYEKAMEVKIAAGERPAFHLSVRVGWMNDPNGFSYYNGEYHLFYQYNPYESVWGPMHWGHAVSKDLLHWEYLPAVLAPDTSYDKDGCFSGSAVELADGRQLLLYTGVKRNPRPDGGFEEIQTQCAAIGDGRNYEKCAENPLLTEKDLPVGGSRYDFRDPKIWKEENGNYRCVVGNCTPDRDGRILLYESEDGIHWRFVSILAENRGRFGKMWECPDFFELDGKHVLLVSPQDMMPKGFEYHNGNGTLCLIGDFDEETGRFLEEHDQAIDYGIDFYASQTLKTSDGRRIMIGWMQNWDSCNKNADDRIWFGQMSLPRELSVENGRLIQRPVRELEKLRGAEVRYENVVFSDTIRLDGIHGRRIDMEITLRPAAAEKMFRKFAVRFAQDEVCHTAVSFRPYEAILKVDRKFSGSRRAIIHQRRCLLGTKDGCLKLRLILDRFSAEIFVNDGEQVLSITYYTAQSADGISFYADGEVLMDIIKYDLN